MELVSLEHVGVMLRQLPADVVQDQTFAAVVVPESERVNVSDVLAQPLVGRQRRVDCTGSFQQLLNALRMLK